MRHLFITIIDAAMIAGFSSQSSGQSSFVTPVFPGHDWAAWETPEAAGYRSSILESAEQMLYRLPTTSMMIVVGGRVAYSYGDNSQVSYLASARKSILSMRYGRPVADGTINLDQTLNDLSIDEDSALLPVEKSARIRDLLVSSSGVYHPAGIPGGDDANLPARGSQQPGKYFVYNNWDFNVAGAVFEKVTGRKSFDVLETDLVEPLQFQDFHRSRQRMLGYRNQSRYLAYHMFLSGRDMARLGLVMLREGQWNGKEVIPATWVRESAREHWKPSELHGVFKNGPAGYGYLWWTPTSRTA
jgi:CubicO group peptidase (beta-lactamase class C family)